MTSQPLTQIVCIFPRLGPRVGGGKINAMFRRMNLFAAREYMRVVLLNLEHSVGQKVAFANLQADGVLDRRVLHKSLFEFCMPDGFASAPPPLAPLPQWDEQVAKAGRKHRTTYYRQETPVMRDSVEDTIAGPHLVRQVLTNPDMETRLKFLDGALVEGVERHTNGRVKKSCYVDGRSVCEIWHQNNAFLYADSAVTGARHSTLVELQKALVAQAFQPDNVVFVDGITSVYLSQHISARKVLFLHADHRSPEGRILARPRYMIEHFKGDMILTATKAQKARLEADLKPATPIRVIPHYTDAPQRRNAPRAHICTVSRLHLHDKPIHHCIEAFTRVMHLIPGCNYLIYGDGPDYPRLAQLIRHHGCEDRVRLMGPTEDPAAVFASSLMSLAPTLSEGFGLALLESLTEGCPVISYDVDYGPRELITPGWNGELVAPDDIDGIAQAILKLHSDHPAYSDASCDSVRGYSFDAYRDKYTKLVSDLIGKECFFDITAHDLRQQVLQSLDAAPLGHKAQLLDLYISLSDSARDLPGLYWGFQKKAALRPNLQRPLMRCIWLSHRLGEAEACRSYLELFAQRFPDDHRAFVARHPEFRELADA